MTPAQALLQKLAELEKALESPNDGPLLDDYVAWFIENRDAYRSIALRLAEMVKGNNMELRWYTVFDKDGYETIDHVLQFRNSEHEPWENVDHERRSYAQHRNFQNEGEVK